MDGYNHCPEGEIAANGVSPGDHPAKHSGHHGAFVANGHYQQWLPAQFAQFSLGPYHPSAAYYAGPPHQPGSNVAPHQPFVPAGMPPPAPAHDHAPRGWGGMQIQDQRDGRGAHGRGGGGPRNGPRGGRGGGRGGPGRGGGWGGRGRGRGRPTNGYHHHGTGAGGGGEGGYGADGAEDLLWKIKRLPPHAGVEEVAMQGLRHLDSRALAGVMKDLGKSSLARRAFELFDFIRSLGPNHEYLALLDEFTFTSCISNCVGQQDLSRALGLVEEMRVRGIERNVHTFSALMNVCIKSGQYKLALDVYREMRQDGCTPNVVTFNTLIDVYGKSGQWEQALAVLDQMKREGVHPVTRTFNTLMIACNTSSQWQEALRMYDEMISSGHEPNTTTYNALISAYSRAGDLARVLQTFKEMVQKGCERSVITYSSLISACEKAGEWKLALQLFEEMQQEGCVPNVISYNSLITACAQGAQWEKAQEVFEQMQSAGCRPDVVTFTALIQAYERGRQWRRALQAFEEMRARGCVPDTIVYSAIIDALWETGVGWAQRRAAALFRQACAEGLMRRHSHVCGDSVELNLHSTTAGVALLSLHCWLQDLHERVQGRRRSMDSARRPASAPAGDPPRQQQQQLGTGGSGIGGSSGGSGCPLPDHVCIVAGKGKAGKDAGGASGPSGHSAIKEAITAQLRSLKAPFKESPDSTAYIGRLEATGQQVADWLSAHGPAILAAIVPPSPAAALALAGAGGLEAASPHSVAAVAAAASVVSADELANNAEGGLGGSGSEGPELSRSDELSRGGSAPPGQPLLLSAQSTPRGGVGMAATFGDDGLKLELSTEARVCEAFNTIKFFEETHCLNLQVMSYAYLQQRPQLVAFACTVGASLALPDEAVYDAVLLLDRVMSVPLKMAEGLLAVGMAACVALVAKQSALPEGMAPGLADVAQVTGLPAEVVVQVQANIVAALGSDTSSLSALRCLKLYLERIGASDAGAPGAGADAAAVLKAKGGRNPFRLLHETLLDSDFLNYRPSVVAAAVLFADRKSRGLAPYWPSSLASLTGYTLSGTPELAAAVGGAQRLYEKLQVPAALWNYQPTAPQPISAGALPVHPAAARGPSPPGPGAGASQLPPSSPHSAPVAPGVGFLHQAPAPALHHHHSVGAGGLHAQQQPQHAGALAAAALPQPIPARTGADAGAHLAASMGDALGPHSLPQGAGAEFFMHLAAGAGADPRHVACSL